MPSYKTDHYVSADLARWVVSLRCDDLSPAAIEAAKRFWFDSLACAIGGSATEDAHILMEHYREMNPSGTGPCSVFMTDWRTNPVDAAFLNSHMVRAMDFNDIYWKADPAHPSDLICAPLALCEMHGKSGRDLILATVIIYELQCRFAEIGRPGIREYGWHHATLSAFASAFAAAKILGLSEEQTVHAVGISASRSGTLGAVTAGELTMMKNTVDPWAARMGVESALLAARGFTGPSHIIDGKEGLFHAFAHASSGGSPCSFDIDGLTRDLPVCSDASYRIEACSMKSFPVEALMHSPLSALMEIRQKHSIRVQQIREIRVEVIARAADILGDPAKYRPTTRETADHSLPYAISVGLADGVVGPAQFELERVRDPELVPLMAKVKVLPNTAFESRFPASQPSRVTLVLDSGEEFTAEVDYPNGDPRNPLTWDQLRDKCQMLIDWSSSGQSVSDIAAAVDELDRTDTVASLMQALHGPAEQCTADQASNQRERVC